MIGASPPPLSNSSSVATFACFISLCSYAFTLQESPKLSLDPCAITRHYLSGSGTVRLSAYILSLYRCASTHIYMLNTAPLCLHSSWQRTPRASKAAFGPPACCHNLRPYNPHRCYFATEPAPATKECRSRNHCQLFSTVSPVGCLARHHAWRMVRPEKCQAAPTGVHFQLQGLSRDHQIPREGGHTDPSAPVGRAWGLAKAPTSREGNGSPSCRSASRQSPHLWPVLQ